MAKYGKASTLFIFVGFEIYIFSMVVGAAVFIGKDNDEAALVITGYCAYVLAFIISCMVYFDAFDSNKLLRFAVIILALAAGVVAIAAMGLHGSRTKSHDIYANTLFSSAALMALIGGILDLVDYCR